MKKFIIFLFYGLLLLFFSSSFFKADTKTAYVLVEFKYNSVKELTQFQEDVKKLAEKSGIEVKAIKFLDTDKMRQR